MVFGDPPASRSPATPQLLGEDVEDDEEHCREEGAAVPRPYAHPSEERPEHRPEMIERPRYEDQATKPLAKLTGGGRLSRALSVNHLTAHAARPSETPCSKRPRSSQ